MAGKPIQRQLTADLEALTRERWPDEPERTHLEYIAERHAAGERMLDMAKELNVSYRMLHAYLTLTYGVESVRQSLSHAREQAAHVLAEQQLGLSDEANERNASAKRLQIESRRWLAERYNPREFGKAPAVQVNVGVLMLDALRQPAELRVTASVIADVEPSLIEDVATLCEDD